MSHAAGEIWNHSGRICGFFEYNGTVDFVCTRTYDTDQEMWDNWRKDNMRECNCEEPPKKVILYSSYGGGFHWPGEVCWHCNAIVSGFSPEDSIDGRPFETKEMKMIDHIKPTPPPSWKKEGWKKSFIDILDEEFLIEWWCDGHWCEFRAYEILCEDEKGRIYFEKLKLNSTYADYTTFDLNEADWVMEGHYKWDGCFEHKYNQGHWCGSEPLKRHIKLLIYLYKRAHSEMESMDPWEDE